VIARPDVHWKKWGRSEWNAALFLHFFDAAAISAPVTTLTVTPETLATVTGDPGTDPDEVRQAFLRVVGGDPKVIRHHLSPARYAKNFRWLSEEPPQFLPFLILTCLVATTSAGEAGEIGGFRDRLRVVLGQKEGVSFNLDGLNNTWRFLGFWLDHYREQGYLYRALKLPSESDLGRETWIGISKRLGFPERRDMRRLTDLLAERNLGNDPNPFDVIRAIKDNRSEFGLTFQMEFDSFRELFFGKHEGIGATPFWAAVSEAAKMGSSTRRGGNPPKFGAILFESETGFGEDMFLMSDQQLSFKINRMGIQFVHSRNNASTFRFVAVPESPDGALPDIIGSMMSGNLPKMLPSFRRSPLAISAETGVLLFEKNAGWFESCVGRPREGQVKAFVLNNLMGDFRAAFPAGQCPQFHEEPRYPSWFVSEPFDADILAVMDIPENSPIAHLRFFQPPTDAAAVHLHGGIRVEDKVYLGIPPCLPEIHAPGASSVEAMRSGKDQLAAIDFSIKRKIGSEGVFVIVAPPGRAIGGEYRLVARASEGISGVVPVTFASKTAPSEFKTPTSPTKWFVEAIGPTVSTYNHEAFGWFRYEGECPVPNGSGYPESRTILRSAPEMYESDEAYGSSAGAFMEICAAKAARKKGLPEAEFMDLIQQLFPGAAAAWDLARAWTENCYFDRLTDRSWRVGCYFPVLPHLVIRRVGGTARVTLLGLTSRDIRGFFSKSMKSAGAHRERKYSPSPYLPAPLEWSIDDARVVSRIAKEVRILDPIDFRDLPDTGWSIDRLLAAESEQPGGYSVGGIWDWSKGWFVEVGRHDGAATNVTLERMFRDRKDLPDYYRISWVGGRVWWTYSRVWALLVAYTLNGQAPFALCGTSELVGIGRPRLNIPLGHARRLCVASSVIPGPFSDAGGSDGYLYSFPSGRDRERFLEAIWGVTSLTTDVIGRAFSRILSEARMARCREERISPLPPDLQVALRSIEGVPAAKEISIGRFPARMVLMIRATMNQFGLMRGIHG
jgi:hypothetical protein